MHLMRLFATRLHVSLHIQRLHHQPTMSATKKRMLDAFFNRKPPPPKSPSQSLLRPSSPSSPLLPSPSQNPNKKPRIDNNTTNNKLNKNQTASDNPPSFAPTLPPSTHPTYPFSVPHLPPSLSARLAEEAPALENGKHIADQPHLDLVYFQPFIPKSAEAELFEFLRSNLFFYRVQYKIRRGTVETQINTPRYTTVFGVDESSYFGTAETGDADGNMKNHGNNNDKDNVKHDPLNGDKKPTTTESNNPPIPAPAPSILLDRKTNRPVPKDRYKCHPRPIPACLAYLQNITEASTGQTFNFCLVNYYANGNDSISYHSDDERFLGANPAIASFSLGARRDFLMKHKPAKVGSAAATATEVEKNGGGGGVGGGGGAGATAFGGLGGKKEIESKPLKLTLNSGDMVLMRGTTQANWLHSIPKRKGGESEKGRINITFRKAMVRGGTENYYQYNVGVGGAFRWDRERRDMVALDG